LTKIELLAKLADVESAASIVMPDGLPIVAVHVITLPNSTLVVLSDRTEDETEE
jgi:hypothetical protein